MVVKIIVNRFTVFSGVQQIFFTDWLLGSPGVCPSSVSTFLEEERNYEYQRGFLFIILYTVS